MPASIGARGACSLIRPSRISCLLNICFLLFSPLTSVCLFRNQPEKRNLTEMLCLEPGMGEIKCLLSILKDY